MQRAFGLEIPQTLEGVCTPAKLPDGDHISQTASTSTMIWVRGIFLAACASIARRRAFIFSRLGLFKMK